MSSSVRFSFMLSDLVEAQTCRLAVCQRLLSQAVAALTAPTLPCVSLSLSGVA